MAITSLAYTTFLQVLGQGGINFGSDDIWVALFTDDYEPEADNYFDARDAAEIPDTGAGADSDTTYSQNGQQLKNVAWDWSNEFQAQVLTADSVTWSQLTGSVRYAIVYTWVPATTNTIVLGHIDYGSSTTYTDQPFTVDFSNCVLAIAPGTVASS
jgi:hypothetical protein